jgi:FlaA1/EpsC-like NDP-sugar epimerase
MSGGLIALVTGYTGETGKALVQELIKSNQFKKIILVGRRQVDYTDNEYKEKTVFIGLFKSFTITRCEYVEKLEKFLKRNTVFHRSKTITEYILLHHYPYISSNIKKKPG